jgi:hypothetical protein
MDKTQVQQTYEVFSKLQFVTLNKYIKGMQLLYIALITNQWWIFTNRRKNKIKMDSYDVLVHPIQRDNQKRTCNTMDKIKRKKKRSTKHCTAN